MKKLLILFALLLSVACMPAEPRHVPNSPPNPVQSGALIMARRAFIGGVDTPLGSNFRTPLGANEPERAFPPDQIRLYPRCGGVAIGPRQIVTVNHCVAELAIGSKLAIQTHTLWSWTESGTRAARLVARDTARDLALLETEVELGNYVPVRSDVAPEPTQTEPTPTEPVLVVRQFEPVASRAALGRLELGVEPGDAGAGVFDSGGALIGLVVACGASEYGGPCDGETGYYTPVAAAVWSR